MKRKEHFPVVSLHRKILEDYFDDEESRSIIQELTDYDMENIADELRDLFWDYIEDTWEDYLFDILQKYINKNRKIK